jgi:hypothetical protein
VTKMVPQEAERGLFSPPHATYGELGLGFPLESTAGLPLPARGEEEPDALEFYIMSAC